MLVVHSVLGEAWTSALPQSQWFAHWWNGSKQGNVGREWIQCHCRVYYWISVLEL